ncbi:MAG: sulfotransferase family protein [Bacteroidales bacterium]
MFFILGRPRSGTTLLRTLLDAHPEIKVPPEYPVLLNLYRQFGKCRLYTPEVKKRFWEAFKERLASPNWQYSFLDINEEKLWSELQALPENASFKEVFCLFYAHYSSIFPHIEPPRVVGDKHPLFATYAWRIRQIFPDARFIFLVRDYRDNFLSVRKFSFEAPIVALQAYRWKYVARIAAHFQQKFPDQTLLIRYEDLAHDPVKILRQVLLFLDLEWNSQMLDYYKYIDVVNEKYDKELLELFHKNLGKPINRDAIGQWKHYLKENEIKVADFVVGSWAERMGYERKFKKPSLRLFLISLPWKFYGWTLYKIMNASEYLPAGLKKRFALFLPSLSRLYHRLKGKTK